MGSDRDQQPAVGERERPVGRDRPLACADHSGASARDESADAADDSGESNWNSLWVWADPAAQCRDGGGRAAGSAVEHLLQDERVHWQVAGESWIMLRAMVP